VPKREALPGHAVVNPGVLVLGQPGDDSGSTRPPWAKNGSFLVYRHLKQLVPEFNAFLKDVVLGSIIDPPLPLPRDPNHVPLKVSLASLAHREDLEKRVNFLGARLVGRWKSGMISVDRSLISLLMTYCLRNAHCA
jgi:hypothetical protein